MDIIEEWKDIDDFEGIYKISNLGNVKNLKTNKLLKGSPKGKSNLEDYLRVVLHHSNKKKTITIHKLVATAFIPNPENKPFIDHINRNKMDNKVSNLRWATKSENQANIKYIKGKIIKGFYTTKNQKYQAICCKDGIKYCKLFKTEEDAVNWRKEKSLELFGEYSPYYQI